RAELALRLLVALAERRHLRRVPGSLRPRLGELARGRRQVVVGAAGHPAGRLARLAQLLAQAVGLALRLLGSDARGLRGGAHLVGRAARVVELARGLLRLAMGDHERVAQVARLLACDVRLVPRPLRLPARLLDLSLEVADLDAPLLGVPARPFELRPRLLAAG